MGKPERDSSGTEELGENPVPVTALVAAQAGPLLGVALAHLGLIAAMGSWWLGLGIGGEELAMLLLFPLFWGFWAGRLVVRQERQLAFLDDIRGGAALRDLSPILALGTAVLLVFPPLLAIVQALGLIFLGTLLFPFVIPVLVLGPPHLAYFTAKQVAHLAHRFAPGSIYERPLRVGLAGALGALLGGELAMAFVAGPVAATCIGAYIGAMAAGAAGADGMLLRTPGRVLVE